MKTLYIDSSRKNLVVAIADSNNIIFVSNTESYYRHSNFLMNEIIRALNSTKLDIKDINNIVVLNGPGSFTGVRVGVTIAKTLAWSLNKNIYSLTTLEALSLQCSVSVVISVISDKSNFGYVGMYKGEKKEENYYDASEIIDVINNENVTIVCLEEDEFVDKLYKGLSNKNKVTIKVIKDYDYLKVISKAISKEALNPHLVEPIYLKKIDAEKKICD